jgi:hypothetical protein
MKKYQYILETIMALSFYSILGFAVYGFFINDVRFVILGFAMLPISLLNLMVLGGLKDRLTK